MDKKMYLAKAIMVNKQVTDYQVLYQVDKPMKPRGGNYEILYGVDTLYPKAVLDVKGQWVVDEDASQKTQAESQKQSKEARKTELIAQIQDMDISKIKKIDDLLPIIKKLMQHILEQ